MVLTEKRPSSMEPKPQLQQGRQKDRWKKMHVGVHMTEKETEGK